MKMTPNELYIKSSIYRDRERKSWGCWLLEDGQIVVVELTQGKEDIYFELNHAMCHMCCVHCRFREDAVRLAHEYFVERLILENQMK